VRTTLTLDDDVAAKLRSRARRTGRPFRDVVNDTLRRGLAATAAAASGRTPFVVHARDFGAVRPGLDVNNVADVLERVEGPLHR
jgi:plasmid stability protein